MNQLHSTDAYGIDFLLSDAYNKFVIYLVRHCQYEGEGTFIPGRLPVPLSSEGVLHAEKLRDFFADKNITNIYTSPVLRAVQTADSISRNVITPIHDIRLAETMSAYQGQRYEHGVDWHDLYMHRNELGGEGFLDQEKRMRAFWDELVAREPGNVVIVSHGHPLWALYCSVLEKDVVIALFEQTADVSEPEEYQKMGVIRPLHIEGRKVVSEPLIHV